MHLDWQLPSPRQHQQRNRVNNMYSHLNALELRLSNTKRRATNCKPHQATFWAVTIAQIEKEIVSHYKFLGIVPATVGELTDDELLNELS